MQWSVAEFVDRTDVLQGKPSHWIRLESSVKVPVYLDSKNEEGRKPLNGLIHPDNSHEAAQVLQQNPQFVNKKICLLQDVLFVSEVIMVCFRPILQGSACFYDIRTTS
ncbi:Hypothetical predicted protein [Xyrichtys novacula]|uniref:Uncharacterized protein n=1 Tax=Xyrichtys novacula TaxID=13765 RepID=A0AAV1FIS8_XYRNO|nr:Hypothetical predicted protein [Xyrichtys novacula]